MAPTSGELDLTDYQATASYFCDANIDLVIHAAGKVGGIQANMREPLDFLVKNIDIGRNVILASRVAGVRKLINLASSCIYPRNHQGALTEDLILKGELEPTNEGYALAKIVTMKLAEYIMCKDSRFKYKTLIPCNLYGKFDKFDPAHSHLIPAIIHKIHVAMHTGQSQIDIWGDGQARREFMYAGDLADAIITAINEFESLPSVINVGLGHDYTIDEYYQAVAEVLGYQGEFLYDHSKPVGMARKLLSVERQQFWGWAPKYSLQQGIKKTYDYYLQEARL